MSQFVSKIKSIKGGFTTALPINITDHINRRAVRNARVGYNPETILHPSAFLQMLGQILSCCGFPAETLAKILQTDCGHRAATIFYCFLIISQSMQKSTGRRNWISARHQFKRFWSLSHHKAKHHIQHKGNCGKYKHIRHLRLDMINNIAASGGA